MGRLEGKHWALIGAFLTATFTVTAGLDQWSDALRPAVLSGLMVQAGTLISAVFVGAPSNPNARHNRRRADHR
jgi:hypothetical protein